METNKSRAFCCSGGCAKKDTFDWWKAYDIFDVVEYDVVEVSFKDGVHKDFYHNPGGLAVTGDMVVVSAEVGYDVGRVSLSGELVKLQIKKKKVRNTGRFGKVIRLASKEDLEKLAHARSIETQTMIRARAIAKSMGLDMKIGDVRYQGDLRQATFYYIADGRVDFRELIKVYAREFKIRIRMHQIGVRQESGLIGGLGSCGRELCCSSWLHDLRSVSTAAARYQNLSFNQAKLSGQCGRLKCCLNYELDYYVEALAEFPKNVRKLLTEAGPARHIKTDIFRKLMYFAYEDNEKMRGKLYALRPQAVKEILEMNKRGQKPANLTQLQVIVPATTQESSWDYENVGDVIELPPEKKRRRTGRRRRRTDRHHATKSSRNKNTSRKNKRPPKA